MELTIKELAAYLPYGLKVQHKEPIGFLKEKHRIEVLESVSYECCTFKSSSDWYFDLEENDCEIKPILYPLDYLTKEITHNEETFVPIERLFDMELPELIEHRRNRGFYYEITPNYVSCSGVWCAAILKIYINNISKNRYCIVQKLLEWKLDIFNLIENNLAIAVTEEFNPYK